MPSLSSREFSFGRDHRAGVQRGLIVMLLITVPLAAVGLGVRWPNPPHVASPVVPWLAR